MAEWKIPPKAKVYEALTAVADGRVKIKGQTMAEVVSSSGDKTYSVEWSEDAHQITSNDNASYWQGYIGYPIIAVLLALDKINFKQEIAKQLAGISWKKINTQFKRNYQKAVDSILQDIQIKGGNKEVVIQEVDRIFEELNKLHLEHLPQQEAPSKITKINLVSEKR